jgi:hypothetical protein
VCCIDELCYVPLSIGRQPVPYESSINDWDREYWIFDLGRRVRDYRGKVWVLRDIEEIRVDFDSGEWVRGPAVVAGPSSC